MQSKNKKVLILSIMISVFTIGFMASFAFFNYSKSTGALMFNFGNIYAYLNSDSMDLNIEYAFPETEAEAEKHDDNLINFSLTGYTEYNSLLYYDIKIKTNEGIESNYINPDHFRFSLYFKDKDGYGNTIIIPYVSNRKLSDVQDNIIWQGILDSYNSNENDLILKNYSPYGVQYEKCVEALKELRTRDDYDYYIYDQTFLLNGGFTDRFIENYCGTSGSNPLEETNVETYYEVENSLANLLSYYDNYGYRLGKEFLDMDDSDIHIFEYVEYDEVTELAVYDFLDPNKKELCKQYIANDLELVDYGLPKKYYNDLCDGGTLPPNDSLETFLNFTASDYLSTSISESNFASYVDYSSETEVYTYDYTNVTKRNTCLNNLRNDLEKVFLSFEGFAESGTSIDLIFPTSSITNFCNAGRLDIDTEEEEERETVSLSKIRDEMNNNTYDFEIKDALLYEKIIVYNEGTSKYEVGTDYDEFNCVKLFSGDYNNYEEYDESGYEISYLQYYGSEYGGTVYLNSYIKICNGEETDFTENESFKELMDYYKEHNGRYDYACTVFSNSNCTWGYYDWKLGEYFLERRIDSKEDTAEFILRTWISNDVIISDTNPNADYCASENCTTDKPLYSDVTGSIKVEVTIDMNKREGVYSFINSNSNYNSTYPLPNDIHDFVINGERRYDHFGKTDEWWDSYPHLLPYMDNIKSIRYERATQEEILTRRLNSIAYFNEDFLETNRIVFQNYNRNTVSRPYSIIIEESSETGYYDLVILSDGLVMNAENGSNLFNFYLKDDDGNYHFLNNVESVSLANLDVGSNDDLSNMFLGVPNLKSLDLTEINTHNAKKMSGMFSGLLSIDTLDVSSLDLTNCEDMSNMFSFSNFKLVGYENLDTSNVKNMKSLFKAYFGMDSIDLSKWDTSNVEEIAGGVTKYNGYRKTGTEGSLLENAGDINSAYTNKYPHLYSEFMATTSNQLDYGFGITFTYDFAHKKYLYANGMFLGSTFKSINISNMDFSNVDSLKSMFALCHSLENVYLTNTVFGDELDTTYMFFDCTELKNLNLDFLKNKTITNCAHMIQNCDKLVDIEFNDCTIDNDAKITYFIANCDNLVNVVFNNSGTNNYNSSNYYRATFYSLPKLEKLDIRDFVFDTVITNENYNSLVSPYNYSSLIMDCNLSSLKIYVSNDPSNHILSYIYIPYFQTNLVYV